MTSLNLHNNLNVFILIDLAYIGYWKDQLEWPLYAQASLLCSPYWFASLHSTVFVNQSLASGYLWLPFDSPVVSK